MSEIDVQRDVVDVDFGLRNSDNKPAYSLEIKEWTKDNFKIKLDFLDPNQVSKGNTRDSLGLKFKNPNMFVSEKTGQSLQIAKN